MTQTRKVGILLFDDVEVLDFAGPFEVFSLAGKDQAVRPFEVVTVGEKSPVRARNGMTVIPTHRIADTPPLDILVVTGGPGARQEIHNQNLIQWIQETAPKAELVLSVCTGALLLAKAGLVEGLKLTTHHQALEELKALAPSQTLVTDQRFVDNGRVILSAGVSSGIDMSFYVLEKLLGEKTARETARYMEYPWNNKK